MKERTTTSALPISTLHHEGKITHARFAYTSSTIALPKTTMHHEGNPMYVGFHSITRINAIHCAMKES
jgi:hypothetical protein